jgi:hypothetical protein
VRKFVHLLAVSVWPNLSIHSDSGENDFRCGYV